MHVISLLSSQPWMEKLGWTLVHFLWQGVVIAIAYAAARRMVRSPQARYALGCAALVAMLAAPVITFSVTNRAPSAPHNPYLGSVPVSSSVAVAPVGNAASVVTVIYSRTDAIMPWVVMVWFTGTMTFWLRLTVGWLVAARMRREFVRSAPAEWQVALDDLRRRIGISRPVRLVVSALVQVPAVVGWLRPVVLMPVGALAGLPVEHIEMLLAHELAHVRRHDCLLNVLQSVVEALLFYHPAVWWISGHVRHEREVCCDDVAVAMSGDAFTYACALADLESRRPAFLNPALAANGGSLAQRIGRLLNQPAGAARPRSGAAVVAGILMCVAACGLYAQVKADRRVFEAVAIKPNELGGGHSHSHTSAGRWNANMTTKSVIQMAFGIKQFQIAGGPSWLDEANYDFVASTGDATTLNDAALEAYLQSLLTDRFHLVYHREMKELPAYGLVTAKDGPKLTPHKTEPGEQGAGTSSNGNGGVVHMTGRNLTMAGFASFLARQMDRPVIDETRIPGTFDVKLDWASEQAATQTLPTIFSALQEQLGLRLNSTKAPVEILVVDSVDKPSQN